jgi:hypothetical protein
VIPFRTHVVSLVAVLLALAAGVALGGGPLSEVGRGALASAPTTEQQEETAQTATFGDRFAARASGKLYAGGLDARPTALLTLPGADEEVVSGIVAEVEKAGGNVTATYAAEPALLEPAEKSLVDTLGSQLMTQLGSGTVEESAPTYERLGQLLARAIAGPEKSGSPADGDASSIRQSLAGAELVAAPEGDPKRAALVLVVLGDDADDDVLSGLLAGLAAGSVGVVAVGDTDSGADGDVAALRTSPVAADVATVDGAETNLGRVTATLALIRSLKTSGGAFGASGADGAVPLG